MELAIYNIVYNTCKPAIYLHRNPWRLKASIKKSLSVSNVLPQWAFHHIWWRGVMLSLLINCPTGPLPLTERLRIPTDIMKTPLSWTENGCVHEIEGANQLGKSCSCVLSHKPVLTFFYLNPDYLCLLTSLHRVLLFLLLPFLILQTHSLSVSSCTMRLQQKHAEGSRQTSLRYV